MPLIFPVHGKIPYVKQCKTDWRLARTFSMKPSFSVVQLHFLMHKRLETHDNLNLSQPMILKVKIC